jgi:hypothetical protein
MNLLWDSDKQDKTVVDTEAKQRLAEQTRNMEKQLLKLKLLSLHG